MAYHVTEQWINATELCSSFCNATKNQSGLCPAPCLHECPPICQTVLIRPTTDASSVYDNSSGSYSLDPFFIATFACLAVGFLAVCSYAVYLKYYSKRRRLGHEAEVVIQVRCESDKLGMPASGIGSVGIQKYREGDYAHFKEMECAVCLDQFHDCEVLRILPNCSHAFHLSCIDVWLGSHVSCPICRASIVSGIVTELAAERHINPL